MTVLFVIELDVLDADALKDYSAQTPAILQEFGGTLLLKGKPQLMHDSDPAAVKHSTMVVFQFPSKEAAVGWYNSAAYQTLLPLRDRAMNSTFRILS
jgi:uncharacterized protein (DUF1330 family)